MTDINRFTKHLDKNLEMHREKIEGEEGVDYIASPGGVDDPSRPSDKLL
jgi:hypothetical protein